MLARPLATTPVRGRSHPSALRKGSAIQMDLVNVFTTRGPTVILAASVAPDAMGAPRPVWKMREHVLIDLRLARQGRVGRTNGNPLANLLRRVVLIERLVHGPDRAVFGTYGKRRPCP